MNKSTKVDDDDVDDLLDNLLADTDLPIQKKSSVPSAIPVKVDGGGRSSSIASASAKQKDDAYFETLTAKAKSMGVAEDAMSDVSEADPAALLREMDMDYLDSSLFKSNKKSSTSSEKATTATSVPVRPSSHSVTGAVNNDRPPTRSGVKAPDSSVFDAVAQKKASNDVLFDEEDILGSMGLDSPPPAARKPSLVSGDSESNRPARSVLDDLLAPKSDRGSATKEKKTSSNPMEDFMSSLKSSSKGGDPEPLDEDFGFGGYMPSTMTSSRPSSKRSVRFDDTTDGRRPSSQPSNQPRDSIHDMFLDDTANDWLDSKGSTKAKASVDRPRSEGSVSDKPPTVRRTAQTQPPDTDWLGFNRIGSPDTTPRQKVERDKEMDMYIPGAKLSQDQSNNFDFLTVASSPTKNRMSIDDSFTVSNTMRTSQSREKDDITNVSKTMRTSQSQEKDDIGNVNNARRGSQSREKDVSDWLDKLDELVPSKTAKKPSISVNPPGSRKGSIDFATVGSNVDLASDRPVRQQSVDHEGANSVSLFPEANRGSKVSNSGRKSLRVSDDALFPETPLLSKSLPWESTPAGDQFSHSQLSAQIPDKVTSHSVPSHDMVTSPATNQMTSFAVQPAPLGAASSSAGINFNLGEVQKQLNEEMVRQQAQQAERLHQMQTYQEQMQKIRDEQERLFQHQLQQQSSSSGLTGPYFGKFFEDLQATISRLESEKKFLQNMLDTNKTQHEEEINLIKENHVKQLTMSEESYKKREERLKEDNRLMSEEMMERMKLIEKEKSELFAMHLNRQSELEKMGRIEIDRLKETYRADIEQLQTDHRAALDRVVKAKELELDALAHSRDHAKSLEIAILKIGENAQDLNDLRNQVSVQNVSALNDREAAFSMKDESLKVLQDRLERQQHNNEMERSRLQGLITKLELQLTEQSRELEEEKWQVRQQESVLKAGQSALEQERLRLSEQVQRERMELDRNKNKFIEDQQASLAELNRERALLAEQRAEFSITSRLKNEEQQRTTTKSLQSDAELEGAMRAVNDERTRLTEWRRELEITSEKLKADQQVNDQHQRLLAIEKQKLEKLAGQVRDKSAEIDDLVATATSAQQDGQRALSKAQQIESEHNERFDRIQSELQMLHSKQKQIAEERLSLSKEKSLFERTKSSALCVVCRTPIQDSSHLLPQAVVPTSTMVVRQATQPLQPADSSRSTRLSDIYTSIQQDRTIRLWRHAAEKDKDFLEEEDYFLEAIKHAPYHIGQRTT